MSLSIVFVSDSSCAVFKLRRDFTFAKPQNDTEYIPDIPQSDRQLFAGFIGLSRSSLFPAAQLPLPFVRFCLAVRPGIEGEFLISLSLPRKEVIQPHLPIRLPCYDFTPVIGLTLDGCLLAVSSPASGAPNSHGVTGGVYKARERIHRGILIRDY